MRRVEVSRHLSEPAREELVAFVERLAAALGRRPLSDHLWLDLNAGGGPGFIAVSAADPTGTLALAQISAANEGSILEVAVDETVADATQLHDDVFETAIDTFRRDGGGQLTWWVDGDDDHVTSLAASNGLALARGLHEMHVDLPLAARSSVPTRPYTHDDADAWLRVNNRAFADHPEQGGWTPETLALRTAEPWFDPDGFRLYELDGRVVAFCWTKVHREMDPPVGEIYVIGVDPELHGRGLGRELTLAGLDWMVDHGLASALLYVDAGNAPALRLYERLGFTIRRSRFAFAGTLTP
jgi:mycothiol synthase